MEKARYDRILKNIAGISTLDEDEKSTFIDLLEHMLVPKKTMLLQAGEVCKFEAFIYKGCARIYYVNEAGVDVTMFFVEEEGWLSDAVSFYEKKPSAYFIETLEDTEMYVFSFETKERLLAAIPKFERIFSHLILKNFERMQSRLVKMITGNTADQYVEFLKFYPALSLRIPQYLIASYLGVTPAFLSVIKRKLSGRKVDGDT